MNARLPVIARARSGNMRLAQKVAKTRPDANQPMSNVNAPLPGGTDFASLTMSWCVSRQPVRAILGIAAAPPGCDLSPLRVRFLPRPSAQFFNDEARRHSQIAEIARAHHREFPPLPFTLPPAVQHAVCRPDPPHRAAYRARRLSQRTAPFR